MRMMAIGSNISFAALAALAVALRAETPVMLLPPLAPAKVLAAFKHGAGRVETAKACGLCHAPTMITGKHYSADKWADTVDHMVDKGAKVNDADYDTIVNYLARSYGPVAAVPTKAAKALPAKRAASKPVRH